MNLSACGRYETQVLVNTFRKRVQEAAEVVCWMDIGGGLTVLLEILENQNRTRTTGFWYKGAGSSLPGLSTVRGLTVNSGIVVCVFFFSAQWRVVRLTWCVCPSSS